MDNKTIDILKESNERWATDHPNYKRWGEDQKSFKNILNKK